jgi:proteasome-associated ATPase
MIGKAAATAMADLHGASAKSTGFIYVKGPELLSMWVGSSESNIRSLFDQARRHKQKNGYPAIVFIDEADAILGKRGAQRFEGMERTTVPMFLAEMDGLEDSGALVLLATNRPDTLDPAVVRDGRIDRKIHIARPTKTDAEEIFFGHAKKRPLALPINEFAAKGASMVYDPARSLYRAETETGTRLFCMRDLLNGAMIAGICESAAQFAIRREIASGECDGINLDDLIAAVKDSHAQLRHLNHSDEIAVWAEDHGNVTSIERVKDMEAA